MIVILGVGSPSKDYLLLGAWRVQFRGPSSDLIIHRYFNIRLNIRSAFSFGRFTPCSTPTSIFPPVHEGKWIPGAPDSISWLPSCSQPPSLTY